MTIARNQHGHVCPRCTREGRPACRCGSDMWDYPESSLVQQFREAARRERRRTLYLVLFVVAVIFAGAWLGSTF